MAERLFGLYEDARLCAQAGALVGEPADCCSNRMSDRIVVRTLQAKIVATGARILEAQLAGMP